MKLFLFAIVLVAVCFPGCGTHGFRNPSFYNEATGQCSPNGLTGPFIDNNNDGLVDCTLFESGMPVFFTNTNEEALSKRLAYLHYLINAKDAKGERYFTWQDKTPEQLKDLIQNCKGELYVAPDGCTGKELLPYPGGFAIWLTRGSETGKYSQAEYERLYKPKTPHRPEEARLQKKIKEERLEEKSTITLLHLCTKPAIVKNFDLQIILYFDCDNDGQLDEYYAHSFPRAGEKQQGSTVWYNLTINCQSDSHGQCILRSSDKGKELQKYFEEEVLEQNKRTGGP